MAVGNLGSLITFQVSDSKAVMLKDISRDVSGRWAAHARIGKKPLRQFLGPENDKVTFSVTLDARYGVKPRKTLERMERYVRMGTPALLVIGGKKVGRNKYTLNSLSETWDEVWNEGELVSAKASITLEEYPAS